MAQRYRALTWDHPRGFNALAAAAERLEHAGAELSIHWDKQPLEGFESHPIADLCSRYDLVVLDHPHLGEALATDCLQPLETLFPQDFLDGLEASTVGPCFSSYEMDGQHWALPLDAATQVMAYRPDLISSGPPATWDEMQSLSRTTGKVALSLAGPHAILTFHSMATAFGEPPAIADPDRLIGEGTAVTVLELMADLASRSPASVAGLNPIGILEHMSSQDDVALCPLIYGYVNYASAGRPIPLAFGDVPRAVASGRLGSTLGGTGIGVSRRCEVTPALIEHLTWLMSAATQAGFIPDYDGQPSNRDAWNSASVNVAWGDFYRNTIATVEDAYVRPRHDGAIAFQTAASQFLRDSLNTGTDHREVARQLNALYSKSRHA